MRLIHQGPASFRSLFPLFLALSFALLLAPLAFAAPAADEAEEEEYSGNITITYQAPKNAANKPAAALLKDSGLFETTVDELNGSVGLPKDLAVVFGDCGKVNAFYDAKTARIIMCYEFFTFFRKEFGEVYENAADADQATLDSALFIFHHELGHALVHLLDLPITGKEEDAVDDLATLVLLHGWEGGDESALNAADSFYMIGEKEEAHAGDALEKLAYYDEHSLGKQRYYQIACIVYGYDPAGHADLVGEVLPKERAARCQSEYEQKSRSWETLLANYFWAAEEDQIEQRAGLLGSDSPEVHGALGEDGEDTTIYEAVVNQEEQYSIWPADRELLGGWSKAGMRGTKEEVLAWIKDVWIDMRPLSLRKKMEEAGGD